MSGPSEWIARILLLFLLLLPAALQLPGQTTGAVQGRVTDSSGSPLPGAAIEAASVSLQGTRTAVSGRDGTYHLPALSPGVYKIKANLPGFGPAENTAAVSLDATATVNFSLDVAAREEVLVSGDLPLVDVTSTTSGTNYVSGVITRLPVARNYADIVRSNPGVSTDRGDTQGRSLALAIYGATSAENLWIIDGINTTNVMIGVQGKAINNEFVQEVEVKTGGYQAEYGRALGGIVNVITKSGGNTLHGDGFVYYDSTATAAQQQFKPGDSGIAVMRIADGRRLDSGVDLGGFILKDRLWFFGAYDRVNIQGDVSRVESSAHVSTDDRFPFDATDNLYSGKLTWNPGPSTMIVGTVFADPSSNSGAAGADPRQGLGSFYVTPPVSTDPSTWFSVRDQGGTDYGVRLTQIFGSRALAALQGSFHRDRNSLTAPEGVRTMDETCEGGTPGHRCKFPPEPNSVTGGYGLVDAFKDHNVSSRRQVRADATLYGGNHDIKAGGDYQDGRTEGEGFFTGGQLVRIQNEFGQRYYRHEFYAVSQDDPTVVSGYRPSARVLDYGAYAQDSWRAAPGLTLNLGLRWDGEQTRNNLGQTVLKFNGEWQPRIGVVWDPWKNGATKIYAFAGRFSYALPTIAAAQSFGNAPADLLTYNFDPVSTVQDPNVLKHEKSVVQQPGGQYGTPVDAGVKPWYQDELTVGVERLFGQTLTVGLKGTYRRLGNALEDRCDLDSTRPETGGYQCALVNPGSSGRFARGDVPTCNGFDGDAYACGDTGPATPPARRLYRGIEVLARKTVADHLWLQASYVYSSLRGNFDGGVNEGAYGQTAPGNNGDFDLSETWHNGYGNLALDRPHRFRLDGYWVTRWSLSLGLSAFAESGAPVNRLGYLNCCYAVFLVPRGSEGRLPTLWEANLTLGYPIAMGPVTVMLQAYVFNVFNNQIATSRDDLWSSSPPADYPASVYDPNQEQNNPNYGKVTGRSAPRQFRAAARISF